MSLIRDSKVALITGTSSNLGLSIAKRLVDQIPESENVTIIVSSRTLPRAKETITALNEHFMRTWSHRSGSIDFDYILVDFTNMVSVLAAATDLQKAYRHIDYIFFNASQTVVSGIDWIGAVKEVLASPIQAATNPTYKVQAVGRKSGDQLGLVFQGNVFGPYYLLHRIKSLVSNGGRVIWISSIMSGTQYLSFDDMQLIKTPTPYEGSKRLIDLMHVATQSRLEREFGIKQYLVQPGIFTSFGFFQYLNFITYYGMMLMFYIARIFGLPHHNISGYKAANAPVRCAVSQERQDCKVGSACDRRGREYVSYSDIDATGAEDVAKYIEKLCLEWDEKLAGQILDTRQI